MNPDTTSCKTEVAGGMLSGRSPVASAGICCPPPPPPSSPYNPPPFQPVTGAADWLAASKWQACGGPEGLVRVRPRGSSSLCAASRGLTLERDTCRDPRGRGSAGRPGHRGGGGEGGGSGGAGCSICSPSQVLAIQTHAHLYACYLADELFFSY